MKSSKTGSWAGCIFLILCLGLAGSQAFALYEPEQITPNVQSDGTPFFLAENSTIRIEWNGVNASGADVINGYIFAWSTSSEKLSDTVLNYQSVSGEDDDTSANNGTLKSTTFDNTFFVEKPRSFFEADDSNLFRYFHLKTWYIENGTTFKYSSDIVTGPINVDTIAPSGTISLVDMQGQEINATTSTNVQLNISAGLDPLKMFLNEDQIRPNESIDFASQATYSLKNATTGTKTIYAWFQDEAGNISDSPATDSIELLGAVIKPNTGSFDLNQGTQAFTVDNSNALYDWTIFNATAETQNATVVSLNGTVNGTNSINASLLNPGTFQLRATPSTGGTPLESDMFTVAESLYTMEFSISANQWSLIGISVNLDNTSIDAYLDWENIAKIALWTEQGFLTATGDAFDAFTSFTPGLGYFILGGSSDYSFDLKGSMFNELKTLHKEWNLINIPVQKIPKVEDFYTLFEDAGWEIGKIAQWTGSGYLTVNQSDLETGFAAFTEFQENYGYWVYVVQTQPSMPDL